MPKPKRPRFGSMGVWPRVRARRQYPRVRHLPHVSDIKLLEFAAYKSGMTHVIATGQIKGQREAGIDSFYPVTILECPPMRIAALRLYKKQGTAKIVTGQLNFKVEKELHRKTKLPKQTKGAEDIDKLNPDDYSDVTIMMYTMPKLAKLKKTPELFEVHLGGSVKQKLDWLKSNLDKNISVNEVFKEGQHVDARAINTGKGLQGPVKRFGVGLKQHKSEKGVRRVGSLGGWSRQGHVMYRVAHAGQMGYHQRIQYNNTIMKISDKPEEVNPKGGFIKYGILNTTYIMIRGSIPGPKKRLVILSMPVHGENKEAYSSDAIKYISKESPQGR